MNRQEKPKPKPNVPVDWKKETIKALKITGRVLAKASTYLLNGLLTLMLVGILTGIIVGVAFSIYVKNCIDPTIDESLLVTSGTDQTTKIYYMQYTDRANRIGYPVEIESERLYGEQNSLWASYNEMPTYLKEAFVAIEDHRFWDHKGVDWIRTGSAVLNFFFGDSSFGGSSITQQLVKNLTDYDDVKIQRKVQEILAALNLEKTKSKEEILEMYLNIVPLSQGCYGVQAAAYTYFGKDVSELSLIECAAIAGITKYPTKYDPIQNPENNQDRRDTVLARMLELGKITQAEFDEAYDKELVLNVQRSSNEVTTSSWYTDTVIEDIINDLVEQKGLSRRVASNYIYSGGLQIYTPMDPEVQKTMEEVYSDLGNVLKSKQLIEKDGIPAESAMVIVDPYTSDLLGVVGARGEKTGNRILNYATQTTRPPGSSIKPIAVYGPALEEGIITYGSVYDDVPVNFGTNPAKPVAWPANLPVVYNGLTTVNSAIERSVNTVAIRVLQDLTIEKSYNYIKNKLGVKSVIETAKRNDGTVYTDKALAPLALGQLSFGLTVREITNAYTVFPNGGIYNESRSYLKVTDSNGNIILDNNSSGNIVFKQTTSYIMTKMMQNVMNNGTARSVTLRNSVDVAGKTGTTTDDNDRWFVGFTPYYVGGVWYGYAMPKSIGYAANPTALIWDEVMTRLHQKFITDAKNGGEPLHKFVEPAGIVKATYCKDSGKLMTDACRLDPRGSRADVGYFTVDTAPKESCDCHVEVKYDTSYGGGVAHAGSNPVNVISVGLIKVTNRSFPIQVYVTDAEFVYRDLPANVEPGSYWSVPFFINTVDNGVYVGITYKNGGRQYNCFSYENFDFNAFRNPKPVTTTPVTTSKDTTRTPVTTKPETTGPPNTTTETDARTTAGNTSGRHN